MGNCLLCRLRLLESKSNTRCVQTIAAPLINSKLKSNEKKSGDCKKSANINFRCCSSNHLSTQSESINNSVASYNKTYKELFNENQEKDIDRNNNRHVSHASSKYTDISLFNNASSHSNSKKLSTAIPKSINLKRKKRTINNKHVFCDSSLETESNSNDSTQCEISQKSLTKYPRQQSNHLFHISRIPPPSPVPSRRKVELSDLKLVKSDQLDIPMIEYTFYVTDIEICRRPLIDKRVDSIVANCNCLLKIHGQPICSSFANQQTRKVFYKGNPVIPVTIKSYSMSSLRKCIGRLDLQFPYFNVKAFLNS